MSKTEIRSWASLNENVTVKENISDILAAGSENAVAFLSFLS
jgi:hypothetical protein